jgi:hypothetical protein
MKKIGLWIDHRQAIVVIIADGVETKKVIVSDVERQLRRSGDSPLKGSFEPQLVMADDSQQRVFTGHLDIYYDEVIACIAEAESILIFGPGEAKEELKKRLEKINLGKRIVDVQTADKMTDNQIVAKVKKRFPALI